MELIATVAQRSPGPDGTYSKAVSPARIDAYLAAAHAHKMLLILDLQPGRGSFLTQARALRPFLLDPSVSLALDPEWKVGPHARPGNGLIGSSSAAAINEVGAWLSRLVRSHHLPDKLLIVHEFTARMLPDRTNLARIPGLETGAARRRVRDAGAEDQGAAQAGLPRAAVRRRLQAVPASGQPADEPGRGDGPRSRARTSSPTSNGQSVRQFRNSAL